MCDPHINFSKGGASAVDCLIWWSPLSERFMSGVDHLSLLSPCIFSPVSALWSADVLLLLPPAKCSNNNIKISVFERDFGHCCVYCVYFNGCASEGGIVCGCNKVKHLSPSLCARRPLADCAPRAPAGHTTVNNISEKWITSDESVRPSKWHKRERFSDIHFGESAGLFMGSHF
jgi:hypothetical protein